jgi:hypothetical protein
VRWGVLPFVLLAAATPSASAASDQVMTPAVNCCSMLTETLDGVVTATLPLPTLPYDAEVAHDGSVVFRASEGAGYEGIWVARPGQAPVHVTTDVRDTTPTITYDGTRIAFHAHHARRGHRRSLHRELGRDGRDAAALPP